MTQLLASLSLDLDNKWAYLRTQGIVGWDSYPSYLDVVVPRVIDWCDGHDLRLTCFVVGRDAARYESQAALAALGASEHEIGNHSFNHFPWMHMLTDQEIESEIREAEEAIERATGDRPVGFRGPGYSCCPPVYEVLARRGYRYDASSLPTPIGPLARWYFRRTATPEAAELADRRRLFGSWSECLHPNKPYLRQTAAGQLVEIPVTTFPILRFPIHMTYLWYLHQFSPRVARLYIRMGLQACRHMRVSPSILLHPLDFLGVEDEPEMGFFPGMQLPRNQKLELIDETIGALAAHHRFVTMREHAAEVERLFGLVPRPLVATLEEERLPLPATAID